ncbi:MAG: orotidine-5'-phosphate decarboxylase [Chloroflexi bacterium]|nr:orotidine-5'-phosphate decarboxylase [Chloroflexota bacterium]
MSRFLKRLASISRKNRSLVCVGLDPDRALMPIRDVLEFNKAIVDATKDLVCAFKPNLPFYEALGTEGLKALSDTVEHIRSVAPDVLLIGDGKRGDIESTNRMYARALFDHWGFDAATVNPYLGRDSLEPFTRYKDKGVFIVCRTSNPGARDLQDLTLAGDSPDVRPLYQQVALMATEWNTFGNIGLVVGATYPEEMRIVRDLCPDMPILIPGVGAQSGQIEASVQAGVDARGQRAIFNASRQVLYASQGPDFAEAARAEAIRLRNAIRDALAARTV